MSNRMHILTPRPRLYPRPAPRRHLQPARLQRHYNSYAQQHRQQSELKRFSTASQDQEIIQQDVTQISPAQPQGDVAAAASSGLDALPRHKKAQKFESGAAREYRLALQNFYFEEEVREGTIVVRPLSLECLTEVCELLTIAFTSTEKSMNLYTNYMRGQIRQYLTNHLRMVPDAVVLVATLRPAAPAPTPAPAPAATANRERSSGSKAPTSDDEPGSGGMSHAAAVTPGGMTDGHSSLHGVEKVRNSANSRTSDDNRPSGDESITISNISSSSNGSGSSSDGISSGGNDGAGTGVSSGGDSGGNVGELLNLGGDASPGSQRQQSVPELRGAQAWQEGEKLVGTVEMAFTEGTRTRFLTLNPPKDSAYLGNMAVAPEFRRRGYGRILLGAAERLTRLAAFPTIYLHLRFKDTGGAGELYRGAGYKEVKRDFWVLPLFGYSGRFLMAKDIASR
eukprot:CAMPEP_0206140496 /NCGR_PEP_ID=MMETSP1473-20131121/9600_1 /ASSEMBLY_ACC=CAM_ASM_001109 /TAXON_ID=1461547 /ORGANISM="Stichococcus sp, Strain RCC1054" /LENGTH=451 /DNA_ID=CAMNT_0053534655 /DNA_START=441 /DNA_END=1796 /DNA_ORIENTATION=-